MSRKRDESFPEMEYSSKMCLPKNPIQGVPPSAKKLRLSEEGTKCRSEEQVFEAANAGFLTIEPVYEFNHLDSPCTITSRSSLDPGGDEEEKGMVSSVDGDSSQQARICFSSSSLEAASDVMEYPSADVISMKKQNASIAALSPPPPPEHSRQLRKKRKTFTSEECPVCGVTIRMQDVQEHYSSELKKLDYLKKKMKKPRKEFSFMNKKLAQVKANRARRSCSQASKNLKDAAVFTCMVCNPELLDDESAVHSRALLHLTECVGVGGELLDEALQDYTLEDERIANFVDHVDSMSYNRIENVEDDDSPVNVDSDDDNIAYGSPQFMEQHLIACTSDMLDEGQSALREAFLSTSDDDDAVQSLEMSPDNTQNESAAIYHSSNSSNLSVSECSELDESENRELQEKNESSSQSSSHTSSEFSTQPSLSAQIFALKSRIEDLEEQLETKSDSKCNICLGHYKNPLVSINCWHVSCEECWMKTLGAKKLCPQCAKITLPSSLRRIYL